MKRKAAVPAIFLCVLLAAAPAAASANSGPAYWENAPSFAVTLLKDCPVTVEHEDLSFDFSGNKHSDYSPSADVTAAYRMKNPTGRTVKVQMAFPLIARLPDLLPRDEDRSGVPPVGETLGISVDGKSLPFEILPGGTMPDAGFSQNYYTNNGGVVKTSLPGFDRILKSVSAKSGAHKILDGAGQQYLVTVEQDGGVQVQTCDRNTYLLCCGFNGMSSDGSSVTLMSDNMKKGDSVSFLAFGGTPVIRFLSPDRKPQQSGGLSIKKAACSVDGYVGEMLSCRLNSRSSLAKSLLPRLVSSTEDFVESFFSDGNHAFCDSNLADYLHQERLIVLCFETAFPAGEERAVTVRYAMSGAMNSQKSQDPLYSYAYLLNPAKGWAGFKDLNIRIAPPAKAPYLVAGSLSFTKSPSGVYTASLPSLPQNDLTFSLYPDPQVSPKQSKSWGVATFLLCTAALVVIVCLIVHFYHKRKND